MVTVGYTRVSTDKQANEGVSLAAQAEKIKAMALVQGVSLAEIITDDGKSAETLMRPGMQKLLALIDSGQVQTVIISNLDRLTRSVEDFNALIKRFNKRGVKLVSVADLIDTGTANGRLNLNIRMSVSQWEREIIIERTRDSMRHQKAKGKRVGTIPFGYRLGNDGETLLLDNSESRILSALFDLRSAGRSLREIAEELNRQGFRTRRGTEWKHQYIAALIKTRSDCHATEPFHASVGQNSHERRGFSGACA